MADFKPKKNGRGFRFYKSIMRAFSHKVKFYYVDEPFKEGAFILSNHEGRAGAWAWELYSNEPIRLLGSSLMNGKFRELYHYQSVIYYHEKCHWPLFLARLFCLIACPATYLYYRGADVISIYPGTKYRETINNTITSLNSFKENVVMFPEDSSEGYLEELKAFKPGCLLILKEAYKRGIDLPIYLAYYKKKENYVVVDKKLMYSDLLKLNLTKDEILCYLVKRTNELRLLDVKTLKTL